ncbi:hypothetical protein ACFOET_00280 [Parapedobacter deserti]|uniref:Uncharacterized protein n=1 Tax=Parapedobacter deserti TaxID=1912957 RepID=A0ABV7JD65_9SPHI
MIEEAIDAPSPFIEMFGRLAEANAVHHQNLVSHCGAPSRLIELAGFDEIESPEAHLVSLIVLD